MATGKGPAHNAGKGLANPSTPKPQKQVDASDLAQTPRHGSAGTKKAPKGK